MGASNPMPDHIAERIAENERRLPKFYGCLLGGALGDALGYPVEFMSYREICARYGANGISELERDARTGKALVSDDTQMTLFTANAILIGDTRQALRGISGDACCYAVHTYLDWLRTQDPSFESFPGDSWLLEVPELHHRRAPGTTCLTALYELARGGSLHACNDSKGCGGVMRVAPAGLYFDDPKTAAHHATGLAALTHGHPLGYMPAALFAAVVSRCVHSEGGNHDGSPSLDDIIVAACADVTGMFPDYPQELAFMYGLIDLARELAGSDVDDLSAVARLGEGWIAEEALAIAVFSALRHEHDFVAALRCACNHDGDSDSTGAICGNIIGAHLGIEAIPKSWLEAIEMRETIEAVAKDLCDRCQMSEFDGYEDKEWSAKYVYFKDRHMRHRAFGSATPDAC